MPRVVELPVAQGLRHRVVVLEVGEDDLVGRALLAPVVRVALEAHELTRLELDGLVRAGPHDRRVVGEEALRFRVRDLFERVLLPDAWAGSGQYAASSNGVAVSVVTTSVSGSVASAPVTLADETYPSR